MTMGHLDGLGKADGLACQALDAHAQHKMLPLNSLRVPFARLRPRLGSQYEIA
jgi:hypothetical protein